MKTDRIRIEFRTTEQRKKAITEFAKQNNTTVSKLLNDLDPRFAESVPNFLTEDDFFINLDVVEGCQKVIQQLTERYEVYIVTAAMEFPSSMGPKYKWLKKQD